MKLLSIIISFICIYKIIPLDSPDEAAVGFTILLFGLIIFITSLAFQEHFGKFIFFKPSVLKDSCLTVNYDFVKLKKFGNKSTFVKIKKIVPFVYFKNGTEFIDYDGNFLPLKRTQTN